MHNYVMCRMIGMNYGWILDEIQLQRYSRNQAFLSHSGAEFVAFVITRNFTA